MDKYDTIGCTILACVHRPQYTCHNLLHSALMYLL